MMDGRMSALILIPLNVLEIYAGWEESLSSVTPLDLNQGAAWSNG